MTVDALGRDAAPIGSALWERLDQAMVGVATSQLAGRRLLEVRGPFGLGLKDLSLPDAEVGEGLLVSDSIPLVLVQRGFALSTRDLAAYEREPTSMNLGPLVEAALAVARLEDEVIFNGTARGGGLLTTEGIASVALPSWNDVGSATQTVIAAADQLDDNGFHGPYTLALAPARYNALLRRLDNGLVTELQAVREVATDGVVKAPLLGDGGVLVASGGYFAHVVLGQD
ncbi:MAG TPA: family 1 encapsulin nanocompartment shell protein, partial [Thermoleophilia bacterium]|nr:family 1 encapsulin nanocompartment shell protein [Thermoleophilia bacterium]